MQALKLIGLQKRTTIHSTDALIARHIRKQIGDSIQLFEAANFSRFIGPLSLPAKSAGKLHLVSIALISPIKIFCWCCSYYITAANRYSIVFRSG